MRTILIAHNYDQNSFAFMSYELAHSIAKKGNRVIFISHKPFFEKSIEKKVGTGRLIITSWSTRNRPTSIKDFLWFYKIFKEYKPSIVLGHFVGSNICSIVSKIVSFGKVKTYVYYHTLTKQIDLDSSFSFFKKNSLRIRKKIFYNLFCDFLVCPSFLAKKDVEENFGKKKCIVIPNPMRDRRKYKKNMTIKGEIKVSFLGRLDNSKNIILLLNTFLKYKNQNKKSRITLQIAGSGKNKVFVKKIANDRSDVSFKGSLPYKEVDDYLMSSHFTIIPSEYDNLPTVGLESLMVGTPLLISLKTGLTDYLTESKDSLFFYPDENGIKSVFDKVEKNIKNLENLENNARNTYLEKFSIEQYIDKICKLLLL